MNRVLGILTVCGLAAAAHAQPVNDNCSDATPITGAQSIGWDNTGATTDNPGDLCGVLGSDIWYLWTADADGDTTFSLCGSSIDTAITIYSGSCGSLFEVACNDDDCDLQSSVSINVLAGQQYYIALGGYQGETGSGVLNIFPPSGPPLNDNCSDAAPLSGFTTVAFDTRGATTDGPSNCGSLGSDIWYAWTADASGPVTVNTCGSSYDTAISVYSGDCFTLNLLGCNDDSCGLQSSQSFLAQSGQTYMIQVGGFSGDVGPGTLSIESGIIAGPIAFGSSTYYLTDALRWDTAREIALSLGGDLAAIGSFDENEFIRASVLGFDGQDRRGWIGFTDQDSEGNFVWSNGEPVVYTNWAPGEPNNANGIENYAEMLGSNGQWNDVPIDHSATRFALIEVSTGCAADFNGDNQVDFFDYLDFAAAFAAEDPSADFNGDNQVDFFDYLDFANAFDQCSQ